MEWFVILVFAFNAIAVIALVRWLRASRRGHPACGQCGYDVTGSIGTAVRCPECGAAFAEVGLWGRAGCLGKGDPPE